MPVGEAQVRQIVQVWNSASNIVYDIDHVVLRLLQITNADALGGNIPDVLADAINEGYLYIDQIKRLNITSGYRALVGLTPSGRAVWETMFPALAEREALEAQETQDAQNMRTNW